MSILTVEANVKKDVAVVSVRERDKQSSEGGVVLDVVTVGVNDANNFQVVRRAIARRGRVTNMLSDRVLIREKFFRHFFVDNRNSPGVFAFAFGLSEIAPA